MGIFDFFKKKNKIIQVETEKEVMTNPSIEEIEVHTPPNEITAVEESIEPYVNEATQMETASMKEESIVVVSDDHGVHGDNFGGLIGFSNLEQEEGREWINEGVGLAYDQISRIENDEFRIAEASFEEGGKVKMRAVIFKDGPYKGEILSAFPYVETDYSLPFKTKRITEWSHADFKEAEIEGGGRDTFELSFYATDYAVNEERYKSEQQLNIKLSAVGLVLDKSDLTAIEGVPFSPDFCSFMPNKEVPSPSYYDFIGVLNSFKKCKIKEGNYGYLMQVKLINKADDPNFFTIDLFINEANMRFTDVKPGMKITGAFWLQGEIA